MTRKLAVTVFATSLMLVGCGSESTNKAVDAGSDAKTAPDGGPADVVKLDVVTPPGPEAGQPDGITPLADTAVDTVVIPPTDGGVDGPPADVVTVPPADGGPKDTGPVPPDAIPADTVKIDAPADIGNLPPDAPSAGNEAGHPDAPAGDSAVVSVIPDAPASETPDAPSAGLDGLPSVTLDAAQDAASDVLVTVVADVGPDTTLPLDTATADVVAAIDTIIAADLEVDDGGTAEVGVSD